MLHYKYSALLLGYRSMLLDFNTLVRMTPRQRRVWIGIEREGNPNQIKTPEPGFEPGR